MTTTIAALLTCYNRRATTLQCLEHFLGQSGTDSFALRVYLVDDGSTDGSSDAIRRRFPDVQIIRGDGNLFWCRGMRLAWEHAALCDPDFYLWLNDDTILDPGAINTLYATWEGQAGAGRPNTVVVGSCRDPETGEHTYGGKKRVSGHPLILESMLPQDKPLPCDTFEGNVVLVPRVVFQKIGFIAEFQHAMGDTDYGYRVRRGHCQLITAPGHLAVCRRNPPHMSYWHKGLPRWQRWRLLNGRKGLPPQDWFLIAHRYGGWLWFVYWVRPYLRVLFDI